MTLHRNIELRQSNNEFACCSEKKWHYRSAKRITSVAMITIGIIHLGCLAVLLHLAERAPTIETLR
jgi:hypothetical protein